MSTYLISHYSRKFSLKLSLVFLYELWVWVSECVCVCVCVSSVHVFLLLLYFQSHLSYSKTPSSPGVPFDLGRRWAP